MRTWCLAAFVVSGVACGSDSAGNGRAVDAPATLTSTTLDGAVALIWSDNPFTDDPDDFDRYQVYSTSFDIDAVPARCGESFRLEGTTVAPEFIVAALPNGVPLCFAVTAVSRDGIESPQSPLRGDTPRPDARNVAINARQFSIDDSAFRFWQDLNGDEQVQADELGLAKQGTASDADFSIERDGAGSLFLTPVRSGVTVALYDGSSAPGTQPVADLTGIDVAPETGFARPGLEALPGFGYVFEAPAGDGFPRYGAVRVTHVGRDFLIFDWAFQTDPGNPELQLGGL